MTEPAGGRPRDGRARGVGTADVPAPRAVPPARPRRGRARRRGRGRGADGGPRDGAPDNPPRGCSPPRGGGSSTGCGPSRWRTRKAPLLVTDAEHRQEGAGGDGRPRRPGRGRPAAPRPDVHPPRPRARGGQRPGAAAGAGRAAPTTSPACSWCPSRPWPRGSPAPRRRSSRPASPSRSRPPDVLPDRLDTVAQTAYLAFTAGYAPGSGPDLLRAGPRRRGDPAGPGGARPAARTSRRRWRCWR